MKKGFTLIELLVVVLIIGILSSVALPQYTKAVEKSRATEAQTMLGNLSTAEQIYQMSTGNFTGDLSVLDLQLPGVGSAQTNTVSTKNFKFLITTPAAANGTATTFAAEARRITSAGANATGDLGYKLTLAIDANGVISRQCVGSDKTCKSIANGATCTAAASTSKDWCYNSSGTL